MAGLTLPPGNAEGRMINSGYTVRRWPLSNNSPSKRCLNYYDIVLVRETGRAKFGRALGACPGSIPVPGVMSGVSPGICPFLLDLDFRCLRRDVEDGTRGRMRSPNPKRSWGVGPG